MSSIVTVVEAVVSKERQAKLVREYESLKSFPEGLVTSRLQQNASDPNLFQIITTWKSMDALQKMRASSGKPAALAVFENVGATPSVKIFTVLVDKN